MRRDRFGLRIEPPHPASLCADLAARLRARAAGPDTGAARAEVAEALASKWWGLRVLAIGAIGHWRTEADRAWLVERARRPSPAHAEVRKAPRGGELRWRALETCEARRALFRAPPRPEDSGWLLDLWFADERLPGSGLLDAVPEAVLRGRVAAEIRGSDPARLERAILLLAFSDRLDNRAEVLRHLTEGTDAAARRLARLMLDRVEPPRPPPASPPPAGRPLRARPPRRRPPRR